MSHLLLFSASPIFFLYVVPIVPLKQKKSHYSANLALESPQACKLSNPRSYCSYCSFLFKDFFVVSVVTYCRVILLLLLLLSSYCASGKEIDLKINKLEKKPVRIANNEI